jgi:hypothetical protein
MEQEAQPGRESTPEERASKVRCYHTCGQELWFAQQLSGPAFYHETSVDEYAFVTHCPRCKNTLATEELYREPPERLEGTEA